VKAATRDELMELAPLAAMAVVAAIMCAVLILSGAA